MCIIFFFSLAFGAFESRTLKIMDYISEQETPKKTNQEKKAQAKESEGKTPGAKTTTGGKAKSTSSSGPGKAKTTPGGKAKTTPGPGRKAKTTPGPGGKAKTTGAVKVKSERITDRLTTTLHTSGAVWECNGTDGYSDDNRYMLSWHLRMRNVPNDVEFKKGSIFYIRNTSSPNIVIEVLICGLGFLDAKNYPKKKYTGLFLCGEWNESTKMHRSLEESSKDHKHLMFVVQYYYYF